MLLFQCIIISFKTGTSGGPMLTAYVYIAFKETQNTEVAVSYLRLYVL